MFYLGLELNVKFVFGVYKFKYVRIMDNFCKVIWMREVFEISLKFFKCGKKWNKCWNKINFIVKKVCEMMKYKIVEYI